MRPSPDNVPWIVTRLTTNWGRHHPRFVIVTQLVVTGWIVIMGAILLSIGDWPGVLLLVLAGLILWYLYEFHRSVRT